jgi:hypothetical protein
VVQSLSGYGATFLGTYPGSDQLLEVTAGCDCSVEIEDVTRVLSRITSLDCGGQNPIWLRAFQIPKTTCIFPWLTPGSL